MRVFMFLDSVVTRRSQEDFKLKPIDYQTDDKCVHLKIVTETEYYSHGRSEERIRYQCELDDNKYLCSEYCTRLDYLICPLK